MLAAPTAVAHDRSIDNLTWHTTLTHVRPRPHTHGTHISLTHPSLRHVNWLVDLINQICFVSICPSVLCIFTILLVCLKDCYYNLIDYSVAVLSQRPCSCSELTRLLHIAYLVTYYPCKDRMSSSSFCQIKGKTMYPALIIITMCASLITAMLVTANPEATLINPSSLEKKTWLEFENVQ